MKKIVHSIIAGAAIAVAFAAKADTVVWYTFDDLDDGGKTLADSSTIQNKAKPGTHDGTVYGLVGTSKDSSSSRMPYVTNGVPESLRVLDPVGGTLASAADKALRFWRTHGGGNGAMVEIPNDPALRPSSFTVEMFVRVDPEHTNWEMIACQPSTTAGLFGWGINFYKATDNSYLNFQLNFVDTAGVNHQHGIAGSTLLDNKWHHLALTVKPQSGDPSKINIKFFIDYVRVYYYDAPYGIVLPDSAGCPVQIGGTTAQGQHFAGEIGEFRFSNKELDFGEFLRPHNKAIDKDVVLYYDFEDTNAYDGNFGNAEPNLLNKASPILPGALVTQTFTEKGTLPKVDEGAAPAPRLRQAMTSPTWADNSSSLYNNYEGARNGNNFLYCDPPPSVSLADTNFTIEMFLKADGDIGYWTAFLWDNTEQVRIGTGGTDNRFIGRVTQDDGSTQVRVDDTANANDGKWHHLALVREGRSLTLYRDKTAVASQTLSSDSLKTIGTRWYFVGGGGANVFNGWLDSVRVTRRALGSEEFMTSQRCPEGTTIAHLKFDDGTANATVGGGALFEGELRGSTTFSDKVPGYKITDGEGGAVLSKPDVASLSVPNTSSAVRWTDWEDLYYLRKDTNGNERTSGTVELWSKGSVKKTYAYILDARFTENGAYSDNLHAWLLGYDANDGGKPSVLFRYLKADGTRNNQRLTFDADVTDDKWHHWAFTFAPNASDPAKSDIAFYLDHVQLGTVQTLPGRVAYDDTLRFSIGEGGSSFTGLIDEVRISDCVLTPAQFLCAENQPGLSIIVR